MRSVQGGWISWGAERVGGVPAGRAVQPGTSTSTRYQYHWYCSTVAVPVPVPAGRAVQPGRGADGGVSAQPPDLHQPEEVVTRIPSLVQLVSCLPVATRIPSPVQLFSSCLPPATRIPSLVQLFSSCRFALLRFPYSDLRSLPRQLPFLVRYNTVISVPLEVNTRISLY